MNSDNSQNKKKNFKRVPLGYNPAEVDEYIAYMAQRYYALQKQNSDLENRLGAALSRLDGIKSEEETVRNALINAQRASTKIIADANERADKIILSIKNTCNAILLRFKEKIAIQKNALADITESVEMLKNDLFEKYKEHIEMIEKLTPSYEYEEKLTDNEYAERVVRAVKDEIMKEYDVSLSNFDEEKDAEEYVGGDTVQLNDMPLSENGHEEAENGSPTGEFQLALDFDAE